MSDDGEYVTPTRSMLRRRLQQMDPYQFEHVVADVWERLGWACEVVGEPGDRGIDVIATATTDEGPQKQLIQAKRYGPKTTVGSPEVQQYASLRLQEPDVDQVTIVTTGEFSRQAEAMADDLGVIEEVDGWGVIADHFDDIERAETVDRDPAHGDERGGRGVLNRIRSLFR